MTIPNPNRFEAFAASAGSRHFALLTTRIAMGGLLFWWGLVKGLNTGVGPAVSDRFYGGLFSIDALLIGFGWLQVAAGIAIALGLLLRALLPFQLVVNLFVALSVAVAFVDPFWLWMGGEKPSPSLHLFYPSLIIATVSWLLIAFRDQDAWTLDRVLTGNRGAIAAP
ncbi:MAG: hypothetical protein AAF074_08465 [Pseudomonadota bacterium]